MLRHTQPDGDRDTVATVHISLTAHVLELLVMFTRNEKMSDLILLDLEGVRMTANSSQAKSLV